MKISVIVPIYNVEDYLKRCLDSIINQTYKNLEILLIDDGSTDSSPVICDNYALIDNRIKVFHNENKGAAEARNFAIKKASGHYLFFVDGDDFIELDTIEKMFKLSDDGKKDIIYCDYFKYYSDENIIKVSLIPFKEINNKTHVLAMPGPVCKLIKKELFLSNNLSFLPGKCFEDNAVMPLISALASSHSYLKESKYYYFQRMGSSLNKKNYNPNWEDIFSVLDYLYQGFTTKKLFTEYKEELEFIYIEYLLHAANLRFIDYKEGIKNIKLVAKEMKNKFPNWRRNIYYKQTSIKYKIICNLFFYNKVNLIKKILRR